MADNAFPRSGSPDAGAGEDSDSVVTRAARNRAESLIRSLPERFRHAGIELARELYGGPGPVKVLQIGEGQPADTPPWYTGLELEEAWAVGQAFRQTIQDPAAESGALETGASSELHAALDRSLLSAAVATLDRNTDAHRRMVQDVSHDLRSPLNSILFLADALRSERSGPLTPAQSHQMSVLYTAAVTLVRMANDLIDFCRLGVGQERIVISTASFSLETVIADVRNLVGPLSTHRGVELRTIFSAKGLRHGDQRLLSRVLLNLVSNALEAVDSGGEVSLEFSDTDGGDLCIEISDDRAGTDVDALRRLMSVTEDRWPGETRGWTRGLGLTISTRLVEAAGGRIDVMSRGAGGSTIFRVDLPFPPL